MFEIYRPSGRGIGAIVVLIAWVATLGWLGVRELHRTEASTLSSQATDRLAPGTVWYALYAGDTQVGNASIALDTLSPGYLVNESVVLETPEGAGLARSTRRTEVWLGATLNLERMHSRYSRAGRQADWAVSVFGDTLTARFVSGSMMTQGRARFDEVPTSSAALPYRLALGGALVTGHARSAVQLEGWPLAGSVVSVTVGPEAVVRFADSSRLVRGSSHLTAAHIDSARAFSLVTAGSTGPRRLWVDRRGAISAISTPFGLRWVRTDFDLSETDFRKSIAERTPAILAALPVTSQFAAAGIRDTFTGVRRFVVAHRDGSPLDPALMALFSGGRQAVVGDTITIGGDGDPGTAAGTPDTTSDPMIQSYAGAISTLAGSLSPEPPVMQRLDAFLSRFHDAIRVDTAANAAEDALGTLAARRGRPDGVARLFVALLRNANIVARYVVGIYPRGDAMFTHAWVEVWNRTNHRWVAMDPVMGMPAANTGLIRLAFAGSSHPDELVVSLANARLTALGRKETP